MKIGVIDMTTNVYGGPDLVRCIFEAKAAGFEEKKAIRFKGGILSPGAYINNRVLPSHPISWNNILDAMTTQTALLYKDKIDVIASVATGAIAHSSVIANRLMIPQVIVKKQEKKTHGLSGLVDGDVKILPEARVLLIEDMSSTFMSSLKAIEILEQEGATVDHVILINTWNLPSFIVNSGNYEVYAGCTGEQILDHAVKCGSGRS